MNDVIARSVRHRGEPPGRPGRLEEMSPSQQAQSPKA